MTRESFLIVVTNHDETVERFGSYETIGTAEMALGAALFERQKNAPWKRGMQTAVIEPIYQLPRYVPESRPLRDDE